MSLPDTREREVKALRIAMQELEQKSAFLITDDHEEIIASEDLTFNVFPSGSGRWVD